MSHKKSIEMLRATPLKPKQEKNQRSVIIPIDQISISKNDQLDLKPDLDLKKPDLTPEEFSTVEISSTVPPKISTVEEFSTVEISSGVETDNSTKIKVSTKGFLKLPNWVLDELSNHLDTNEQLVYIHLFRLSHGYGKDHCRISLDKLAAKVKLSDRTVQKTLLSLEKKKIIKKVGYNFGKTPIKGTDIWVENFSTVENSSTVEISSPIKSYSKDKLKETYTELVNQFRKIYPKATIGDISEEVKFACSKKKIPFDYHIFNDLNPKIWI